MPGTILHVNAVGLMAALEEHRDRSLRSRPFVVAREGVPRAVILDVSPAAHREGLERGMLLNPALQRMPGIAVVAPRPEIYAAADERLWTIGLSFSPMVERAGKGHLFMDLAGTGRLFGAAADAAQRLRRMIMEELGLTPSMALASNKTVTKVATRVFRPGGFAPLRAHEERDIVRQQPVGLLPGVGPVLRDRLSLLEIEEIGRLADLDSFQARAIGPRGPELVTRARCIDDSPVDPEPPERRCLKEAVLLEPDTAEPELLRLHVLQLVAALGFAARKDNLGVRKLAVRVDYSDGLISSASMTSPAPLARDGELAALAVQTLRAALSRRVRVRQLTVEFHDFVPAGPELDLFEPNDARSFRLQSALDRVHGKYGFPALAPCAFLAVAGLAMHGAAAPGIAGRGRAGPATVEA